MAMKRGRPSNKRPVVEPIRRKCQAPGCGKIRLVVYKEWKIPPRTSNKKRYDDNWDRIFGKKDEAPNPYGDDDFATPKESSGSVKHFADGFHEGRWEDD